MCFVNVLNNKTEVDGTFLCRTGKIKINKLERTMRCMQLIQCKVVRTYGVNLEVDHNNTRLKIFVKRMNLNKVQNPNKVEP